MLPALCILIGSKQKQVFRNALNPYKTLCLHHQIKSISTGRLRFIRSILSGNEETVVSNKKSLLIKLNVCYTESMKYSWINMTALDLNDHFSSIKKGRFYHQEIFAHQSWFQITLPPSRLISCKGRNQWMQTRFEGKPTSRRLDAELV